MPPSDTVFVRTVSKVRVCPKHCRGRFSARSHGVIDGGIILKMDAEGPCPKPAGGNFMKKTKIQRLLALILCLAVVVSSFTVVAFASDGEAGSSATGGKVDDSIYDPGDVFDLGMISYEEYLADNLDVGEANEPIIIDAITQLDKEASDDAAYTLPEAGKTGDVASVLTNPTGEVAWKVTVPEKAKYNITLVYYAYVREGEETKADSIERVFKINGKAPFSEARSLSIKKNWVNDYPDGVYAGEGDLDAILKEGIAAGLVGDYAEDSIRGKHLVFEYPGVWTNNASAFCEKYSIRFMKLDIYDNEIRPSAAQEPVWSEYALTDSMGFYTEPFEFVLEKGENVIALEGKNAYLAISKIILTPAEEKFTYSDYKELYAGQPAGSGNIRIEAEYTNTASDKTIYPTEDAADALTSPHDPSRTLLNTMGGEKWQTAGQSVTYKFKVDKSGMYDIVFRFKQNVLDGMFVNRILMLYSDESLKEGDLGFYNGVPFEEAKSLAYNFNENWQVTEATDGTNTFDFYFKEGVVYTMKLEVNLGSMAEVVTTVQDALDKINSDYLSIIQLTGSTPDQYRDYGFSRIMPDVLMDMVKQAKILNNEPTEQFPEPGVAQKLTALAGEKSSNVGTLQKISDLLLQMGRDEGEIARLLDRLKSYIGTLGTFLSDAKTQPLLLDYVSIQGTDEEMPKAKANWWESFIHEIKRFFCSFTRDYDAIGVMAEPNGEEALEVWLATGRDQFQVKRNLVNNDFVSNNESGHDIAVELKLVAAGTLLPSILSGQGPDVYHGLDQGSVINYAIRSAILDVDTFDDFDTVKKSFNEAAMIVLAVDNSEGETHYYGLPEAQGFAMMFVRVDILTELGIDIPQTWDDIMAAIPKLQAKNMQMGLTTDATIHLYQMGGELFADNGMRINLDSQIGLAAFKKTCELFTKYGFPYQYDAANRFRTGEMPIVIADYTTLYNQLKVFATEIEGSWTMVPVPGVVQEDGSINNLAISTVNASVIVKGCDERGKKGDAWEYIKWFTGDECQAEYSNEMVALLGPSAKYNTANIEALEKLPWTTEELARIKAQFYNLASVPNYPGRYILDRYTNFAFLAAYNDGDDPQQAIRSYITPINKEITRKRAEFNLETLEQGQTLADKRFDQAKAAAAELAARNEASYGYLVEEINAAVKLKDSAHLHMLAEEIMTKTEIDKSVIISKGPDIGKFSDKQVLYYLTQALVDAADALLTY